MGVIKISFVEDRSWIVGNDVDIVELLYEYYELWVLGSVVVVVNSEEFFEKVMVFMLCMFDFEKFVGIVYIVSGLEFGVV